jgi:hypothetical protein
MPTSGATDKVHISADDAHRCTEKHPRQLSDRVGVQPYEAMTTAEQPPRPSTPLWLGTLYACHNFSTALPNPLGVYPIPSGCRFLESWGILHPIAVSHAECQTRKVAIMDGPRRPKRNAFVVGRLSGQDELIEAQSGPKLCHI